MPRQSERSGRDVEAGGGYSIAAIERAFKVLNAFTPERPEATLTELVAITSLPKTTTFRLLATLVAHDFCTVDEATGRYSLGFAVLRLGEIRRRQTDAHRLVMPVLREIREKVNETVVLSIRVGDERVHIDVIESTQPVRRMVSLGDRAPLYSGAASKVLLAGMSDSEIETYLSRTDLLPLQSTTITDSSQLLKEVERIRSRGYAESRGELIPGGGALAAPVRDYRGEWVAVIDVLTPSQRYDPKHRKLVLAVVLEGAAKASEALGFRA